jgi:hypothetical protein
VRKVAVVAAVVAAFVAGCSSGGDTRVLVVGDSLVAQATPYLKRAFAKDDHLKVQVKALAGSATCDWFATLPKLRKSLHPDVVVASFSGNALSPCMKHADGTALDDAEYVAKYTEDTRRMMAFFPDARIYLVGAPVNGRGDDRVFRIYEQIASNEDRVTFVDGGKYLTPHHRFALTLPCLKGERCTGPVVHGVRNNVVRTPSDQAHFCPAANTPAGAPCPVYSSGAYRFARAIEEGVDAGES